MHSRELEFSILLPFIGAWWFDLFLTNIDKSHPGAKELLEKGGGEEITVAQSLIPSALIAVDKTMEETFMKISKSAGTIYFYYHFDV